MECRAPHFVGAIDIAQIDNYGLDHDPFKAGQIQGAKKPTFKGSRLNGILQAHYFHALSDFTDHQDA